MPESRNVQLLNEYLGALQASDGEKMASMLHPDLQYWVSPGSAFSGTHDKASLLTLLPAICDAQAGPTKLTYRETTAQDDRVSLVADGKMPLKSCGSRPITGCPDSATTRSSKSANMSTSSRYGKPSAPPIRRPSPKPRRRPNPTGPNPA
jgi:hypothetical protein